MKIPNSTAVQNAKHLSLIGGSAKGFTIVELLIVIIVIGILAAIIIVAYNGVTNSANDAAAKAAATTLRKKLEAYNAEKGYYPSSTATSDLSALPSSTLTGSGLTIVATPDATTGKKSVKLAYCSAPTTPTAATGYGIFYYDYKAGSLPTTPQITGNLNTVTCTAWATVAS